MFMADINAMTADGDCGGGENKFLPADGKSPAPGRGEALVVRAVIRLRRGRGGR